VENIKHLFCREEKMSFEGYYQVICKEGHYSVVDVYEHPNFGEGGDFVSDEVWVCRCGAHAAWTNMVNLTNGIYCDCELEEGCECCDEGRIDGFVELEVKESAEIIVCPCFNTNHLLEAKYNIPEGKGKLI